MALSAAAAAKLAALMAKLGKYNAGLDIEENVKRNLSQQALARLDESVPTAKASASRNLADRGLVQSGIGLGVLDTVNRNYLTQYGDEQRNLDTGLSDVARRRLSNQADFDYEKAGIEREDMFGQPIVPPPPVAAPTTPGSTPTAPPKSPAAATPKPPVKKPVTKPKVVAPKAPAKKPVSKPQVPAMRAGVINKIPPKPVVKAPVRRPTGIGVG